MAEVRNEYGRATTSANMYTYNPDQAVWWAKTPEQRKIDELTTLLSDYTGETGADESATETLGRLLEELEGYRRRALAADIRGYLREGGPADALSFALQNSPKYDNVPGAVIQRIIDKEAGKLEKRRT